MGLSLKDPSELSNSSKKSSHVPLTNSLVSQPTRSLQSKHSKRTDSTITDGTHSVFINTLPSYRSTRPTCSRTSSGSSTNSETSNFHTGISIMNIYSTYFILTGVFIQERVQEVMHLLT